MGLFSGQRRLSWTPQFRWPIRLHSEYSLGGARAWLASLPAQLRSRSMAATNDPRIVGVVLVIAAAGLAVEMAASIK